MIAPRKSPARPVTRPEARNEMNWLLAIAAAFLVVHFVAWTISARAVAGEAAAGQSAISELCD